MESNKDYKGGGEVGCPTQETLPGEKFLIEEASKKEAQRQAAIAECTIVFNALAPTTVAVFNQLQSITSYWMDQQGFWECDNFGEKIALIHSEVSEALEAHRSGNKENLAEELADTILRIMDIAGRLSLPLGKALMDKAQFMLTRPYKHGKPY